MVFLGYFWVLTSEHGLNEVGLQARLQALRALRLIALAILLTLFVTTFGAT